jgi:hypothetical protein
MTKQRIHPTTRPKIEIGSNSGACVHSTKSQVQKGDFRVCLCQLLGYENAGFCEARTSFAATESCWQGALVPLGRRLAFQSALVSGKIESPSLKVRANFFRRRMR